MMTTKTVVMMMILATTCSGAAVIKTMEGCRGEFVVMQCASVTTGYVEWRKNDYNADAVLYRYDGVAATVVSNNTKFSHSNNPTYGSLVVSVEEHDFAGEFTCYTKTLTGGFEPQVMININRKVSCLLDETVNCDQTWPDLPQCVKPGYEVRSICGPLETNNVMLSCPRKFNTSMAFSWKYIATSPGFNNRMYRLAWKEDGYLDKIEGVSFTSHGDIKVDSFFSNGWVFGACGNYQSATMVRLNCSTPLLTKPTSYVGANTVTNYTAARVVDGTINCLTTLKGTNITEYTNTSQQLEIYKLEAIRHLDAIAHTGARWKAHNRFPTHILNGSLGPGHFTIGSMIMADYIGSFEAFIHTGIQRYLAVRFSFNAFASLCSGATAMKFPMCDQTWVDVVPWCVSKGSEIGFVCTHTNFTLKAIAIRPFMGSITLPNNNTATAWRFMPANTLAPVYSLLIVRYENGTVITYDPRVKLTPAGDLMVTNWFVPGQFQSANQFYQAAYNFSDLCAVQPIIVKRSINLLDPTPPPMSVNMTYLCPNAVPRTITCPLSAAGNPVKYTKVEGKNSFVLFEINAAGAIAYQDPEYEVKINGKVLVVAMKARDFVGHFSCREFALNQWILKQDFNIMYNASCLPPDVCDSRWGVTSDDCVRPPYGTIPFCGLVVGNKMLNCTFNTPQVNWRFSFPNGTFLWLGEKVGSQINVRSGFNMSTEGDLIITPNFNGMNLGAGYIQGACGINQVQFGYTPSCSDTVPATPVPSSFVGLPPAPADVVIPVCDRLNAYLTCPAKSTLTTVSWIKDEAGIGLQLYDYNMNSSLRKEYFGNYPRLSADGARLKLSNISERDYLGTFKCVEQTLKGSLLRASYKFTPKNTSQTCYNMDPMCDRSWFGIVGQCVQPVYNKQVVLCGTTSYQMSCFPVTGSNTGSIYWRFIDYNGAMHFIASRSSGVSWSKTGVTINFDGSISVQNWDIPGTFQAACGRYQVQYITMSNCKTVMPIIPEFPLSVGIVYPDELPLPVVSKGYNIINKPQIIGSTVPKPIKTCRGIPITLLCPAPLWSKIVWARNTYGVLTYLASTDGNMAHWTDDAYSLDNAFSASEKSIPTIVHDIRQFNLKIADTSLLDTESTFECYSINTAGVVPKFTPLVSYSVKYDVPCNPGPMCDPLLKTVEPTCVSQPLVLSVCGVVNFELPCSVPMMDRTVWRFYNPQGKLLELVFVGYGQYYVATVGRALIKVLPTGSLMVNNWELGPGVFYGMCSDMKQVAYIYEPQCLNKQKMVPMQQVNFLPPTTTPPPTTTTPTTTTPTTTTPTTTTTTMPTTTPTSTMPTSTMPTSSMPTSTSSPVTTMQDNVAPANGGGVRGIDNAMSSTTATKEAKSVNSDGGTIAGVVAGIVALILFVVVVAYMVKKNQPPTKVHSSKKKKHDV